jgi:hypothetical protein
MSENIYAWLLRLYPARFREAYGSEALQLFRDRARDKKGFFPCLIYFFGSEAGFKSAADFCSSSTLEAGSS